MSLTDVSVGQAVANACTLASAVHTCLCTVKNWCITAETASVIAQGVPTTPCSAAASTAVLACWPMCGSSCSGGRGHGSEEGCGNGSGDSGIGGSSGSGDDEDDSGGNCGRGDGGCSDDKDSGCSNSGGYGRARAPLLASYTDAGDTQACCHKWLLPTLTH